jgi:hypothetical protein
MIWTTILFVLTLLRPVAAVPDVSGSWAISGEINGDINSGTFSVACAFHQTGENIDGVCTRASGDVAVSGQVTEQGVSFQYDTEVGDGFGGSVTQEWLFSGTLDKAGTTMTGKASLGGVGEGTFTAKKQKK